MKSKGILVSMLAMVLSLSACSGESSTSEHKHETSNKTPQEIIVVDPTAEDQPSEGDLSTLSGLLAAGEASSIRVLGDSITAGYLIEGFDAPSDTGVVVYNGGEGIYYETPTTVDNWTNAFRTYAHERGVETFVNAGVSGFRMQYLAEEPDAWLDGGADVIVVMLGTNDAAKESLEDFRAYAERALVACEGCCRHLVVVSPPDNQRTDASNLYGMDHIDQVLNELSASHGWEHISLLDVLTVGTDDFFADQVHPTAEGSAKLWASFSQQLGLT